MTFISALKIETVEAKLSYVTTKPYLQIKLFGISEEHLYCSSPLSEGKQTVNVFPSTYYFFLLWSLKLYRVVYFNFSSAFLSKFSVSVIGSLCIIYKSHTCNVTLWAWTQCIFYSITLYSNLFYSILRGCLCTKKTLKCIDWCMDGRLNVYTWRYR